MLPVSRQKMKSLYDTAVARIKAGQLDQAAQDLTALLKTLPNAPEVHFQLSVIAEKLGQRDDRAAHLSRALALSPNDVSLNEAAVEAFGAIEDYDAALSAHDRLIAAAPNDLKRKVDKALTLQYAGQFEAAETLLHSLITKNPKVGALYRIYMMTAKIPADDPLMDRMRKLVANPKLPDLDRMHICYANAKALEGQGRLDQVFPALDRANGLQRKLYPLDHARNDLQNAALRRFQDGADLTPTGPDTAIRSVFVTGMPRSGTTLVEQILASHSQVTAGGEMSFASRLAVNLFGDQGEFVPLATAPQSLIDDFARGYVQAVRNSIGIRSGVVTDKAIQAHRIYGLLHRALKGVRFMVVHRDPRDIALSIYKNHFRIGTHRYANDLADIAQEIKNFRANVSYWKTRLPDAITEIRYEDLVSDPEPQIRALIAAAGLDWEDACLDFHASKGTVKTLSLQQVRQPIYKGSAQAWRKYETELAPFIAAWGNDPWD